MSSPRILVLDSGVGGLSIVSQIRSLCSPHLGIDYLADWAEFPYGSKTEAQLTERLMHLVGATHQKFNPSIIIIACNTASTLVLNSLRQAFSPPIIGVVPAIKPAARLTETGSIGLLATEGTLKRAYTAQLIQEFASHRQVHAYGSQALVLLAERKLQGFPINMDELRQELDTFILNAPNLDTLVLACTHFPLLLPELQACFPQIKHWVDSGAAIARRVNYWLDTLALNHQLTENVAENRFFYTQTPNMPYDKNMLTKLLGIHSQFLLDLEE